MTKRALSQEDAQRVTRLAKHWRQRAAEFRKLARGAEASMFKRAAQQAEALARSFERGISRRA